ncbi:MAG: methyltransferase domain-containing protein [Anaerolineales bacterium]|nr:methyltransferase domain-containing protein [Anaerolineales bacterium]
MNAATPPTTSERVARYYDQNTWRFLRFGGSGEAAAIHRQIWAQGVDSAQEAFLYLNRLAAQAIQPALPPPPAAARLLDLGCGVGGTATWMAEHLPHVQVIGVTNSAVQRQIAAERAESLGLGERCHFIQADFMHLPPLGPVQAAYAIESFIHAPDPLRFFEAVAGQLAIGGRLVVCDDFLTSAPLDARANRWVERFREGWQVNSLLPAQQVKDLAQRAGLRLVEEHDLSAYLRPFPPILLNLMKLVTRLPLRSAYWDNLSGGAALQVCIQNGWSEYRALVWEKAI